MTPIERVVATLTGQTPDRVPVVLYYQGMMQWDLQALDYTWEEALNHPRKLFQAIERQYLEYVFDNFMVPTEYRVVGEALGSKIGYTLKTGNGMRMPFVKDWVVKEPKDVLKLKPSDPQKDGRMPVILNVIKRLKRKYPEVPIIGFVASPCCSLTDVFIGHFKGLFVEMVRNPQFIHDLLDVITESTANFAKAMIEAGAAGIGTEEPVTDVISLEQYEEFIVPYHRRIRDAIAPAPYALHQCGDATPFIPTIIENIKPAAFAFHDVVDYNWVKETYGDKVLLAGGPPCSKDGDVLMTGTPEDVDRAVKEYLKMGMPGGKFWLTAGCEVHQDVPPENLKAFIRAARLYGHYN